MSRAAKKIEHAHKDSIWSVAYCSEANVIVTGSVDETVKIWDAKSLECKQTLKDHHLGVVSVAINNEGTQIATSSIDSKIRIWNLDGSLVKTIDAGPVESWSVTYDTTGNNVATGSQTGNINIFNVKSEQNEKHVLNTNGKFTMSVAYSPNGKYIASGHYDGEVNVFDLHTGKAIHKIGGLKGGGHCKPVRSLSFSPDSNTLFSASDDCLVNAYDMAARGGEKIYNLGGHTSWVLGVAASPDGNSIATCSSDRKVKIYDLGKRTCTDTFETHSDQVWDVAYSKDGKTLVSVGDDSLLNVYEIQNK